MRFAFTSEQRAFQREVRALLEKECTAADVRAAWEGDAFDRARWGRLAAMGVIGMTVPEVHDGLGMDGVDLVLALEEAGRACMPEPLLETTAVCAPLIAEVASDEARAHWLPRLAAGEAIVTIAHAANGFAPHAHVADVILVHRGASLYAFEREHVTLVEEPSVDGARRLFKIEWEPSEDALLVDGEPGRAALETAFDRGALAAAAELVGVGARAIDLAAAYAVERHQFGKPIGSFQAVKHQLADALVAVEFARPAVYRAAWSVARDFPERGRDVSMAKALASDAAVVACRAALQVHGAIGYTKEHDLHLWLARGFALANAWGDPTRHRSRVTSAVMG